MLICGFRAFVNPPLSVVSEILTHPFAFHDSHLRWWGVIRRRRLVAASFFKVLQVFRTRTTCTGNLRAPMGTATATSLSVVPCQPSSGWSGGAYIRPPLTSLSGRGPPVMAQSRTFALFGHFKVLIRVNYGRFVKKYHWQGWRRHTADDNENYTVVPLTDFPRSKPRI